MKFMNMWLILNRRSYEKNKNKFKYRLANACNRNNLIFYALNHPEASFPWSNSISYTIYISYLALTIYFIIKKDWIKSKESQFE